MRRLSHDEREKETPPEKIKSTLLLSSLLFTSRAFSDRSIAKLFILVVKKTKIAFISFESFFSRGERKSASKRKSAKMMTMNNASKTREEGVRSLF